MVDLSKVLTDMVRAIVDNPRSVAVTVTEEEDTLVLSLAVSPDDMGKVIGKHGRIARAIRMVMKAAAVSADRKIVVKIQ